jgi:hypothetical protein
MLDHNQNETVWDRTVEEIENMPIDEAWLEEDLEEDNLSYFLTVFLDGFCLPLRNEISEDEYEKIRTSEDRNYTLHVIENEMEMV